MGGSLCHGVCLLINLNTEIKVRSTKDGWNEYDSIAVINQDVRIENMSGWKKRVELLLYNCSWAARSGVQLSKEVDPQLSKEVDPQLSKEVDPQLNMLGLVAWPFCD